MKEGNSGYIDGELVDELRQAPHPTHQLHERRIQLVRCLSKAIRPASNLKKARLEAGNVPGGPKAGDLVNQLQKGAVTPQAMPKIP